MTDQQNLFKKYNVAGPRYTSYPTVPYWETSPTPEQWIEHLGRELAASQGAAVYVHIPFCESLCTFCGCNKRITKKHERATLYTAAVHKEWALYKEKLTVASIPVSEVHLGGGTPTFYTPQQLRDLLEPMLADFTFTKDAELSFEADPRVTSHEHLQTLYDLGFRRMSLGVQDFSPKVQKAINREQSVELVEDLTQQARALGYTSINYDLVYGLPFQTLEDVRHTIETVIASKPDRIAFYGYAHVPWVSPGQRGFEDSDVPDGDAKRELYELGRQLLDAAGYREIGLDHFALESDSLWQAVLKGELHRNFMGYMSRHVSPMIGLGCSSISDAWSAFAQNEKTVETYQDILEGGQLPLIRGHVLSAEDLILRRHIQNLMCHMKTNWQDSDSYTNYLSDVLSRIEEFKRDNLISINDNEIIVNEQGRPFLRNICMAFDARLSRRQPDSQLFSKTI